LCNSVFQTILTKFLTTTLTAEHFRHPKRRTKMKKLITICCVVLGLYLTASSSALANAFYAITNEIGYQGTIWNETDSTGPWTTSTPRDGYLYAMVDYPGFVNPNYNYLMSNWQGHHLSNQNDSFLQIGEDGNPSVTAASGSWDSSLKVFTVTVNGANATYDSSYARFWQPDNGVAWGVTLTDYTYSFTATFAAEAAIDSDGWLSNTVDPDSITGTFTGHFVVTDDVNKNPITDGDTYGFDIGFSKDLFVPLDPLDAYGDPTSVMNYYGTVPEPGTLTLLGLAGMSGLAMAWIRRRRIGG
jgi:hypothetical protein